MVGDPVERRRREDRVHRRVDGQWLEQVRDHERDPRRRRPDAGAPRRSSRREPSSATTSPPGRRSSSCSVTRPEPQPASSTRSSPRSGSRSRTTEPQRVCGSATRSYVAASQSVPRSVPIPEYRGQAKTPPVARRGLRSRSDGRPVPERLSADAARGLDDDRARELVVQALLGGALRGRHEERDHPDEAARR